MLALNCTFVHFVVQTLICSQLVYNDDNGGRLEIVMTRLESSLYIGTLQLNVENSYILNIFKPDYQSEMTIKLAIPNVSRTV